MVGDVLKRIHAELDMTDEHGYPLYTYKEIAERYGVHPHTIWRANTKLRRVGHGTDDPETNTAA
jgi:DNA-binding transcriptional regulator YhcF (GntR family)